MQNTPQTFRGTTAPGVNFSDHTYDNHIGVHCQPSGYQPYSNPPYHPIPSPRPHHYGNHQIQQSMPYRHHGGAYAPNQNQYTPGMNQEMYRNHHSGYVGANNRNMPSKPWADSNSSADLMPYGQHTSHPQLMNSPSMNSPSQMPVTAMRSPPHATSNMNPTPSQGQQHFRQMQSPAHSPHSWSQAQIPSPNMMHSSRTTPSPLPAHVRSPGHGQPFSPPAAHAMNLQQHPPPPENGQISQAMNSASGTDNHKPSNPLHSLQKMVMLEQDSKSNILPRTGDGNEQFNNQCGSHSYVPEEGASNESKDSAYSTYFDLDENCFQSKPNNTSNDASLYSAQQVSNCSFSVPSHPVNSEMEVKGAPITLTNNSNITEAFHSDHSSLPPQNNKSSSLEKTQCSSSVPQNDCAPKLNECPPHAESAPVFTDQTKAAVSTNSEQALESNLNSNWASECTSEPHKPSLTELQNPDSAGISNSSLSEDKSVCPNPSDIPQITSSLQIKCENVIDVETSSKKSNDIHFSSDSTCQIHNETSEQKPDNQTCKSDNLACSDHDKYTLNKEKKDLKSENSNCNDNSFQNPSILKLSSDKLSADLELKTDVNFDSRSTLPFKEDNCQDDEVKKPMLRRRKVGASYEEAPSPENEHKTSVRIENRCTKKFYKDMKTDIKKSPPKSPSPSSIHKVAEAKPAKELARNPVKVVIHRIRKSDTNDTWHVPGNNKISNHAVEQNWTTNDKPPESKAPNIGPQIIILSPAMSQKKFGFRNTPAANSVVSTPENKSTVETVEKNVIKDKENSKSSEKNSQNLNSDKKRGRPVGSKNKLKPGVVKRKKGKKGNKRKKIEMTKQKNAEILPKAKKLKIFNGPYVHITGSKENPLSISVVNVAQKEEEKISKIPIKRNFSSTVSRIKKQQVGHLSTLSPTYDAFNRDKTWMCVFCHKGSHHGGLGDLYGPYYIKDKSLDNDMKSSTSSSPVSSVKGKRRKSDPDDSKSSKKSRQSSGHSSSNQTTPSGSRLQNDASSVIDSSDALKEVWIHEDCAIWCQSISLIGEEVRGLEEAVTEASENICCHCSLDGATVGCWGKSCKEQYHFSCAKETGCQMDIENFSLLCPKHQKKSADRRSRCQ